MNAPVSKYIQITLKRTGNILYISNYIGKYIIKFKITHYNDYITGALYIYYCILVRFDVIYFQVFLYFVNIVDNNIIRIYV